jgi:hypothetical protein
MNDLADRVLLSRSGRTRLVDRLEREGPVERHARASGARGLFAVLTAAGQRRPAGATPTYHRIRECLLTVLADKLQQVATASRLAGELAWSAARSSPAEDHRAPEIDAGPPAGPPNRRAEVMSHLAASRCLYG